MKNIFRISFLILPCITSTAWPNQSVISKIYCSCLGDKDVCSICKEQVYQALTDLGVEEPSNVAVKQMNGVGPSFALIDVSSFTAFGIWLDEAYLHSCSEDVRMFHIYHEAAHYALNHHQKLFAGCGVAVVLAMVGLAKLSSVVCSRVAVISMGMVTAFGCYRYILPYLVKQQEKQADLLAAKVLMAKGKQHLVVSYIDTLRRSEIFSTSDLWWYSNKEQIEYLEAAIIKQQDIE